MKSFKAVGFDLGGVLIQNSVQLFYHRTMGRLGVSMEQLEPVFEEAVKPLERGEINEEMFWHKIASGVNEDYRPEMLALWSEGFEKETPAIPHMLELVDKVKAAGYKVGLLSNTTAPHVEINRRRGIFEHFDVALMSDEIGARKPEPAAYKKLAEALAVDPSELIFIDDLTENVAGAEALGITAIKFAGYHVLVDELKALGIKI